MKQDLRFCSIERYDESITEPPYDTIKVSDCKVLQPQNDTNGVEFASRLQHACMAQGYRFKFYTLGRGGYDYKIVVY